MTCPHLSRIGTRCTRPVGHDGAHVAGFTDRGPALRRTWAAICALTFACDRRALDYLLTKEWR